MKFIFNKRKIIIINTVLVIMLIAVITSLLYRNVYMVHVFFDKYIFRKNITENTLPKIYTENSNIFAFNNYIVCLENNKLKFYKSSAEESFSLDVEVSSPIIQTNGKYLCIA